MSNHKKSSALKEKYGDEAFDRKEGKIHKAEIIPWPDLGDLTEKKRQKKKKRVRLDQKFLYYKGKKIPILQFQKSGYDKLLKLLVKEIGR
ncbi:MAG: hypothetical protein ACLFVG_05970 [Candidatus Aminicenantes bacterium]